MKKLLFLLTFIMLLNKLDTIDAVCGTFTQITGSPFTTGTRPVSIDYSTLIGTNTLFAVTANSGSNNLSVYKVDLSSGAFTQVPNSPFAAGNTPLLSVFSPLIGTNTLFAAAVNNNGPNISVYSVNTNNGFLTPVIGSPFSAGSGARGLAFSPLIGGTTLFASVANFNLNTVSIYSVNIGTGAFTLLGSMPTGARPIYTAFSPLVGGTKLYLAVANQVGNSISVYTVNI